MVSHGAALPRHTNPCDSFLRSLSLSLSFSHDTPAPRLRPFSVMLASPPPSSLPPSLLPFTYFSRQETGAVGGAAARSSADDGPEEINFIDAGFHALGTNAVEGEEGQQEGQLAHHPAAGGHQQQQQPLPPPRNNVNGTPNGSSSGNTSSSHDRSAMMYSVDGAAAAAAASASSGRKIHKVSVGAGGSSAAGPQEGDEEDEDEEEFGGVELVVTQDGGIIPVPAAEAAAAAAAAATATVGDASSVGATESLESEAPITHVVGRDARKVGARGRVDGKDGAAAGGDDAAPAAVGNVRKGATGQGVGGEEGEGRADGQEEEGEEEEAPLPPDIMLTLADDVLHRVMLFLNPEEIFECRAVNSRWEFPGHEAVFEGLCRRTYLAQVSFLGECSALPSAFRLALHLIRAAGMVSKLCLPACMRYSIFSVRGRNLINSRRYSLLRHAHRHENAP